MSPAFDAAGLWLPALKVSPILARSVIIGPSNACDGCRDRAGAETQVVKVASVPDDATLVAMTLRDRNDYAPLVNRYEAPLGRYVSRLLGRRGQVAEDIVQEAFIKAYVNLRDYDRSRPFAPWIYRIAHNEAVNFLRKHPKESLSLDSDDGRLILERLTGGTNPETQVALQDAGKLIDNCMHELGQRYRDVLVLRFLEDKSYSDIADIMKLPPGTVATLIRRGLQRLREVLETLGLEAESWEI